MDLSCFAADPTISCPSTRTRQAVTWYTPGLPLGGSCTWSIPRIVSMLSFTSATSRMTAVPHGMVAFAIAREPTPGTPPTPQVFGSLHFLRPPGGGLGRGGHQGVYTSVGLKGAASAPSAPKTSTTTTTSCSSTRGSL